MSIAAWTRTRQRWRPRLTACVGPSGTGMFFSGPQPTRTESTLADHWPLQLALDPPPDPAALLTMIERLRAETPNSRLGVGGTWTSPKQDVVPAELWPIADAILKQFPRACTDAGYAAGGWHVS